MIRNQEQNTWLLSQPSLCLSTHTSTDTTLALNSTDTLPEITVPSCHYHSCMCKRTAAVNSTSLAHTVAARVRGTFIHSEPGSTSLHAGNDGRPRTEAGTGWHRAGWPSQIVMAGCNLDKTTLKRSQGIKLPSFDLNRAIWINIY